MRRTNASGPLRVIVRGGNPPSRRIRVPRRTRIVASRVLGAIVSVLAVYVAGVLVFCL